MSSSSNIKRCVLEYSKSCPNDGWATFTADLFTRDQIPASIGQKLSPFGKVGFQTMEGGVRLVVTKHVTSDADMIDVGNGIAGTLSREGFHVITQRIEMAKQERPITPFTVIQSSKPNAA